MSLFPREMESERLRYERLHPDDVDPYELYEHAKVGAPAIDEITRWVTWDPYETPKEAADWIEARGEAFEANEGATYVLRPREGDRAGEFAGLAGVGVEWDTRVAGFGTWLRKPFWGRGYSGERAARLLELVFERLDLDLVRVEHDPENEQSEAAIRKYVERFGGRREGRIRNDLVMNGEPRDSVTYSISKTEYEAAIDGE